MELEGGHHKYEVLSIISCSDENPARIDGNPAYIKFSYLSNMRSTALLFGGIT